MRSFCAAWLVGLCLFGPGRLQAQTKTESLQEYEKKIQERRNQLKELSAKEGSVLAELDRYSQRMEKLESEISDLTRQKDATEKNVKELSDRTQHLAGTAKARRQDLIRRLRQIQTGRSPAVIEAWVGGGTPVDLQKRRWFTLRWIETDHRLLATYHSQIDELSEKKNRLQQESLQVKRLIGDLSERREHLAIESAARKTLVARIHAQQNEYEKGIRELELASRELQRLIESLREKKSETDSAFASMRGRLPMPVLGKIEQRFGAHKDRRLNTKLYHKGLDIRADAGLSVRAVYDGKVVYSGWFTGYGKIVILDHGGGYFTLYAHASKLLKKEGDPARVGEAIALVGDTGSLKGPYLYFELRNKGVSQDPWPWFSESSK